MAINIKTRVITRNFVVPIKGALAVYLLNAKKAEGLNNNIIILRSLAELESAFPVIAEGKNSAEAEQKELKVIEYILQNRVPVVAIVKDEDFTTDLDTLELEEEIVGFISPFNSDLNYSVVKNKVGEEAEPTVKLIDSVDGLALVDFIKDYAASAYIDLEIEDIDYIDDLGELEALPVLSEQIELAYGETEVSYESIYTIKDFYMPASVLLAIRKSRRYINDIPWIPVAGQENGKVPYVTKLKDKLTKVRKNILQDLGANVLDFRRGVGYFFASQNTLVADRDTKSDNPLIRSHIVHLKNIIHRDLEREVGNFLYKPNNNKTQTLFDLKLRSLFNRYRDSDAIHRYDIATGEQVLTDEEKLKGTLLKAIVAYRPVNAVEDISVELYITNVDIIIKELAEENLIEGVGEDA